MTTNINPAIVLNDEIRAYLQTQEAKKAFEDTATLLKEEENVQRANDLRGFMEKYGEQIQDKLDNGSLAVNLLAAGL